MQNQNALLENDAQTESHKLLEARMETSSQAGNAILSVYSLINHFIQLYSDIG